MWMTWPFSMVKPGVNPLAWKKCCHSAMTDSPTLHSYSLVLYLVLYGPGPWHTVLLYLVVCLHASWQEMKVLLLLWQWQPHTIPEALLVTLLSRVHPNAQQLCIDQHLDSDAAVLYRWGCSLLAPPILSSKRTAWHTVRSATYGCWTYGCPPQPPQCSQLWTTQML